MALNARRGRADSRIVRLQHVHGLLLHTASEEQLLQRVERLRDVVLAMEVALTEDARENVFGQDVLDEHLANVGVGDGRVDCLLGLLQELSGGGSKGLISQVRLVHALAQCLKHVR